MPDSKDADLQDIKTQLTGLAGWIEDQKVKSIQEEKPWGWVMAAIAAAIAFAVMALASFGAWQKGREVAKLKHKIDLDEEMKIRAEAQAKITTGKQIIKSQQDIVIALNQHIESIRKKIEKTEKERLSFHEKISKVTNWNDLDKFTGNNP